MDEIPARPTAHNIPQFASYSRKAVFANKEASVNLKYILWESLRKYRLFI